MSREPTGPIHYLQADIWHLVQDGIETRRRIRQDDPSMFQHYAQTLLRSVCGPEEAL